MANIRHPNFILGIIAILLHAVALALRTTANNEVADILSITASGLMVVSWVWSVIEVIKTDTLQGSQKKFWLIGVIAIPFAGGMLYHLMHSKRNTIVD
jgi:Na+/proline symporter